MSFFRPDYIGQDIELTPAEYQRIYRQAYKLWILSGQRLVVVVVTVASYLIFAFVTFRWIDFAPNFFLVSAAFPLFTHLVLFVMKRKTLAPYVRLVATQRGHPVCRHCGYSLRGHDGADVRCPECGHRYNADAEE